VGREVKNMTDIRQMVDLYELCDSKRRVARFREDAGSALLPMGNDRVKPRFLPFRSLFIPPPGVPFPPTRSVEGRCEGQPGYALAYYHIHKHFMIHRVEY